jgi:signal transduction histidine kinase
MYWRFPNRKENLHISLFSTLLFLAAISQNFHFGLFFSYPLAGSSLRFFLFHVLPLLIFFFTPYIFSSLLKRSMIRWWKWTLIIIAVEIIIIFLDFEASELVFLNIIYALLSIGVCLFIYFRATTRKMPYQKVLLVGILGFPFFGILWAVTTTFLNIAEVWVVGPIALLVFITFPLSMTLFVTLDYTGLISTLEEKVSERTQQLRRNNHRLREAKANLEKALNELHQTQDQLVQQEKLASLGQLTAGIAHEIKNPLNFVNNFSDLSLELIEEAREEVRRETPDVRREKPPFEGPVPTPREGGERSEQGDDPDSQNPSSHRDPLGARADLILDILNDIEANLRKIHEHGSRADGIVKSMLEHSRGGSSKPEPVDINDLAEEFVNLSFHGMRAGKRPINVDLQFDLQENMPQVQLVAKDFSRILINLCNNAFDAMWEKLQSVDFEPVLAVSTSLKENKIYLSIEDNGPGIPDTISAKIMEPFFTTKQGTDGTGLGLSITSDIVKAHGGTLQVESKENQFTRFTVVLPVT